jgi:hypothetical protein
VSTYGCLLQAIRFTNEADDSIKMLGLSRWWGVLCYSEIGPARPFNLDGYAAKADVLMFEWHDVPNASITFAEGLYELTLSAWTRDRQRPDVAAHEKFEIAHELQEIMKQKRVSGDNTTRYIPLQGHALLAFTTGFKEVDFSEIPRV